MMTRGSPSRHVEKRSKTNQDRAAAPHTKAALPRAGVGGSRRAAARASRQGPSAPMVAPPPSSHRAPDPTTRDIEVDPEEVELERVGWTLTAHLRSPYDGPECPVSELVPFDSPAPAARCPDIAPNVGGWAPPRPIDFRHNVRDIRSFWSRNLYGEDEKDLCFKYRFWHYFHFYYYDSILYCKSLEKRKPPVIQMKYIIEYSLSSTFKDQEIWQMVDDLCNMGLSELMEFHKNWNNEVIMQFYASYFHETDCESDTDVIH